MRSRVNEAVQEMPLEQSPNNENETTLDIINGKSVITDELSNHFHSRL